jgi:hypothetical protein
MVSSDEHLLCLPLAQAAELAETDDGPLAGRARRAYPFRWILDQVGLGSGFCCYRFKPAPSWGGEFAIHPAGLFLASPVLEAPSLSTHRRSARGRHARQLNGARGSAAIRWLPT